MKNRITASSGEFAYHILCFVSAGLLVLGTVFLCSRYDIYWWLVAILALFTLILIGVGIYGLNVSSCYISYDARNKAVCRDGRLFGFHHEVKVNDIEKVIAFTKEDVWYIGLSKYSFEKMLVKKSYLLIIDTQSYGKVGVGRHAFIMFEDTEKNRAFLKQFWTKSIKHAKSKDIAKYIRKKPN